eukprot:1152700-Pelagomonas_calceolata.AAC.2
MQTKQNLLLRQPRLVASGVMGRTAGHIIWQLREAGQLLPARPLEQLQLTQTISAYFCGYLCWVQGWGCVLFQGLCHPPADHSSLPPSQRVCILLIAMEYLIHVPTMV